MPKNYCRMYFRPGRGWYGDFRNYGDVGGRLEALRPDGSRRATPDQAQAALLFARRLEALEARRAGRAPAPTVSLGPAPRMTEYLNRHAELKAAHGVRAGGVEKERKLLTRIAEGWRDPRLDTITVRMLNDLKLRLRQYRPQTVCHFINSVSSLLQSAVGDGLLAVNVARSVKRPRIVRAEAPHLESHEGHALLVAAAELDADPAYRGIRPFEALIATALLTGVRRAELFALLVGDVDLKHGLVHVRPNVHYPERKSRHAVRRVPLWPQLRERIAPLVKGRSAGDLLFPAPGGGVINDPRVALDVLFRQAGLAKPKGREWHLFRHTYATMRLQTTDGGAPVSPWTVKAELGHGSLALLETTYGHLLQLRHRLDRVEYRPKVKLLRKAV